VVNSFESHVNTAIIPFIFTCTEGCDAIVCCAAYKATVQSTLEVLYLDLTGVIQALFDKTDYNQNLDTL
jgi:hypothetical protein